MPKSKILHIITHLPVGGAGDYILTLLEGLNKNRYDLTLISGSRGDWIQRALNIKGIKLILIKQLIRDISFIYDLITLYKIYRILKIENFLIVHTHSVKAGFLGRIAARLAGVPTIIHTIHGFPFNDFMNPFKKIFIFVLGTLCIKNY